MANLNQIELPNGQTYGFQDDSAVASISKSGNKFTITYRNGSSTVVDDPYYDEIYPTDVQAGNLIVTGSARFLNTINGNIATADKVNKDLVIQLNSGTTEGTNKFTFNGSTAKTVNITKSGIGLGNVENKSSSTIRSELTSENVTTALGYTPVNKAGDTMSGSLKWTSDSLPQKSSSAYAVVIDAFASGGEMGWRTLGSNAFNSTAFLPLAGGTMTGQIKTSFKNAIATGTYQPTATTIPDLINEVRYSSGCGGSFSLSTAYTLTNSGITIPIGWYNFIYVPHRSGGVNGAASGDNCNYGSLYLSGMTVSGCYMIRYASSNIAEVRDLYKDTTYTVATGDSNGQIKVTPSSGSVYNVSVKGLGSNAYTSTAYLPLAGGTLTGADCVFYTTNKNTKIAVNSASILQSPIPKYLWHDIFAFCKYATPKYYTTSDGTTWTEATLDKRHFAQFDGLNIGVISATGKCGSKWEWNSTQFSYSGGAWLVIGVGYADPVATVTITFESSSDNETWTVRHQSTHAGSAAPIWCKLDGYSNNRYLRLSITKDPSDTTKGFGIGAIKLLTARWGDQGGGSELEYPYSWDADRNITMPGTLSVTGVIKQNGTAVSLSGHTHNYAGSSSAGGSATSAVKLDTATAGSATNPVYFTGGKPSACTYSLNATVPSGAIFTDQKVTQTATTTDASYEILFSETADNTTRTEGARKTSGLTYNPSTNTLTTTIFAGKLHYNDTTGSELIRVGSNNKDTAIFRVYTSDVAYSEKSAYGFTLKYMGTGSNNENRLNLYSDNQNASSQVRAISIAQDGNITMDKSLTVTGGITANLTGNATTATTASKLGTSTVGSSGQPIYLNAGVATACTVDTTATSGSSNLVTSGAVWTAIDNLPEPMVFKGTLGTNGTITTLPTASADNEGFTYKVITAGTYASTAAKVGDVFVSAKPTGATSYSWVLIPAGDTDSDSWRNIKINGTEKFSTALSSGAVDFVNGNATTVSFNATGNKISYSHNDTSSQASVSNSGRTYIQSITLDTYGHVTALSSATETVVNTDRYVNSASFADDSTNTSASPVKMTLTRAGSDTATVTANIPKVSSSSAGVAPKGAAVSSQSQTTKFLREDGSWAAPSYTTNTDTKVTSVGNHYAPSADTSAALSATASGATAAWSIDVVKAVQLQRDAKGHVVGITVTSGKIPGNPNTDQNVAQTATTTNANYEILFSGTADNTTRTEGSRKNNNLIFNPSTGTLTTTNISVGTLTADTGNITSATLGSLVVNGNASFVNTISGSIDGNAATATNVAWTGVTGKPSEFAPSSGSSYYVKTNRSSSQSTATKGEWVSMCRSDQTGSPTLPTANKWWHVFSLDCWGSGPSNWTSQLAIATTDGSGVWWRRNDASGTTIDSSTWHRLAEADANGYATRANADGSGNTITSTYAKLSGATFTGNIAISHAASATMTADSTNPKITFSENGTQPVHLIYTDYDNYRSPAGLKVIGGASATPAWFEVEGDIYEAGTKLSSKYLGINSAAASANKLNTNAGSATNPVYFSGGVPVACTYSLNKTVPANAVFTDTTYTAGAGLKLTGTQFDNTQQGIYHVIGTQTAATGSWVGYLHNVSALYDGLTIMYYLPYAGSGNATLNLTLDDGTTTGAIACYYNTSRLTTHYGKGCNIVMTYYSAGSISIDGTATTNARWIANANYVDGNDQAYQVRDYYNRFVAGANKVFPYTYIMQCSDGRWESLVTSSSTGSSKTRNTHGFRLGQIALMYYNSTFNENAVLSDACVYETYTSGLVDHRYSFNTENNSTKGTTGNKPVYLVGAINATDGLFYLDATWWTQTLPTTEDGKLYIYMGDAYDYYRMSFPIRHPIYCYTNGKIRQYSQDASTVSGHTVAKDVPANAVFTNTTYTFANGTNGFTVTPSGGTAQTVTVTPSITNNVTGSGTSGYIAKWNGTNTITNGPAFGTSTTTWLSNKGEWTTPPNDDTKYGISSSGESITLTESGTGTSVSLSTLINGLSTGSSTPVDADYYVSQYVGGGTTTTSYHRRPMSALWTYIKGKADSVYVNVSGDSMTGTLCMNSSNNNYGEGIRINAGANSYSTLTIGTEANSTSGISDKAFWIGTNRDNASYYRKLYIAHNSSTASTTYFYASSQTDYSPSLQVGGLLSGRGVVAANTANSSTAGGLALYGTSPTDYGIAFRGTGNGGKHGYVQGDWAQYHYMAGANTRGWVFNSAASTGVASISRAGHMVLNGSITVGGNATNSSGMRLEWSSTLSCLNFIVVG